MTYFDAKPYLEVYPSEAGCHRPRWLCRRKASKSNRYMVLCRLMIMPALLCYGPMEQATYDDWDWMMKVNVGGVINALVTFLPDMLASGEKRRTSSMWLRWGGIAALGVSLDSIQRANSPWSALSEVVPVVLLCDGYDRSQCWGFGLLSGDGEIQHWRRRRRPTGRI